MVLAGPGSGKTFVITRRILHLIQECNVPANQILVVTFSKAAATEMAERFYVLCEEASICESTQVNFGTFHSVFFSIIRRAYGYHGNQVATEDDKLKLIRKIVSDLGLNTEENATLCSDLLNEISVVKEERLQMEYYYPISCSSDAFKEIYKLYEDGLAKLKKIDFDDMLLMTYDLLSQREDILQSLTNHYRYILVDEFQDINRLQYEIIQLLAGERANLTIVGDDDQSIYRFRGARPEIMLNFAKDYPKVKSITLDMNFRSTNEIVYASLKLIQNNVQRFDKRLSAYRGDGKKVCIYQFHSQITENKAIIEDIKEYIKMGQNIDEIAILYRTNTQPRLLTQLLMEYNIDFVMKDNIPNIYEHWIAKDILAYMKLAMGSGGRREWLRIINKPVRYIKREALSSRGGNIDDVIAYYKDKPYMKEAALELKHCIKTISTLKPSTALKFIKGAVGYEEFLRNYADEKGIDVDELLSVLGELEHSVSQCQSIEEWFSHIEEYKVNLEEQYKLQRAKSEEEVHGVRLMTFHASKGLEYDVVYILDANEGVTPHRKAKSKEDLEEERRMFYVAMTRARAKLNICSTTYGFHKKSEVSMFIKELTKNEANQYQFMSRSKDERRYF